MLNSRVLKQTTLAVCLLSSVSIVNAKDVVQDVTAAMSARDYAKACSALMKYADDTQDFTSGSGELQALAHGVQPERYENSGQAATQAGDHNAACSHALLAAAAYNSPDFTGDRSMAA